MKAKSFVDTVKGSFSKIVLIGDPIVSSLTRYPMIWLSTLNHVTPLILVHQKTVLFCGGFNKELNQKLQ